MFNEAVGRPAIISNVITAVNGLPNSPDAFFLYGRQEIFRKPLPLQARVRHARRVKATVGREAAFHRRIIECADDEIFAGVSLRPPRQLVILEGQTVDDFGPWNIGER